MPARDSRHPQPPSPGELDKSLEEFATWVTRIRREYQTVYDFAFTPGLPQPEFGRGKPHSTASDPTGETAAARWKIEARHRAYRASERIQDALAALRAAESGLLRALPDPDLLASTMLTNAALATRDEVAQAREAQRRRIERGEL